MNAYVDESSQNAHAYLVLGALAMNLRFADQFEADIIAARGDDIPPWGNGKPRIMKWQKVSQYNLPVYKRVVDAFFIFPKLHKFTFKDDLNIHCVAANTSKRDDDKYSGGDADIGFSKEIYFLCQNRLRTCYPKALFHVYADRRTTKVQPRQTQDILNAGSKKAGDTREWPFRRFQFEEPDNRQALQVVDILIGALAFKLNGWRDEPKANAAKKELCDYVLRKAQIWEPFRDTRPTGRFTLWHRKY